MKKWMLSLLMVIGTLTSSFSQTFYPKRILWENDTVLAITGPQLVRINRSLNDYIHLKKTNEVLQMDLCVSDSLLLYWKQVSTANEELLSLQTKRFEESRKMNEALRQSIKTQKRNNKIIDIGVGVGSTLLGVLLGVMLK